MSDLSLDDTRSVVAKQGKGEKKPVLRLSDGRWEHVMFRNADIRGEEELTFEKIPFQSIRLDIRCWLKTLGWPDGNHRSHWKEKQRRVFALLLPVIYIGYARPCWMEQDG